VRSVLEGLAAGVDLLFCESPALETTSFASTVADAADACIVAVDRSRHGPDGIEKSFDGLRPLGIILNAVTVAPTAQEAGEGALNERKVLTP
jgi:hypothetical protein